ncbi:hypothetical protein AKJ39_02955 [candidate division MSBL1 archaeon SCGC-AAA259J03]|uniref:Uncharacterized protein n=1 Tax=candidate division MSBL1 archaeon SCGC-AAA259J03 TaxID=1698269 RepID=A0A656YW15_9EURY|nr:hypothetical protein AKJ39_02955 [candidate division MSBL1 archaeon SCGC-AAA259J03]
MRRGLREWGSVKPSVETFLALPTPVVFLIQGFGFGRCQNFLERGLLEEEMREKKKGNQELVQSFIPFSELRRNYEVRAACRYGGMIAFTDLTVENGP